MKKFIPYILLLPQLILGIIFLIGIIIGITQSFGVVPILSLYKPSFKYYIEIFSSYDFINSLIYSLKISFISSILAVFIGIVLTYILINIRKDKGSIMSILKIPILVPHIILALIFVNILSKNALLARIFFSLGFIKDKEDFPMLIFDKFGTGIILAYLWKEIPFVIYFIIALISSISSKLGEAAQNLGANKLYSFIKISLPIGFPSILSSFLIIFVYNLGAYELPFLLGSTLPKALPVRTYIEFQKPDLSFRPYAMAYNGVIIFISLIVAIIYFYLLKKVKNGELNEKY